MILDGTREAAWSGYIDDGHLMALHHISIERLHGRDVVLSGGHAGALTIWNLDHSIHTSVELGHAISGWDTVDSNVVIAGGVRGFARIDISPSTLF